MERITIYRHADCDRCARIARFHRRLDWFGHVACSTDTPRTGPLRLGEIAVEDHRTRAVHRGVEAVRHIARHIPAYLFLLPFLYVPAVARRVDRDVRGCDDGSCALPDAQAEARFEGRPHARGDGFLAGEAR